MSRLHSISLTGLVVAALLACVCGCSTIRLRNPYETDYDPNDGLTEDAILTHFNLHRGRWWNYYKRGSWLLAGGYWDVARRDFEMAADLRPDDKWDARTYGMHFIDYFPHREWGIAFCLEGEREKDFAVREKLFAKAIEQLGISIEQTPSSKAAFYLKRATAGYWKATQADATPPVVAIANREIDRWADVPTLYINRYTVALEIQASDRQSGIAEVSVDGRKLFIESVEKDFNEPTVVSVDPRNGTKTVDVNAVDLAGNKSELVRLQLIVDTTPPTAAITVRPNGQSLLAGPIPVEIVAMDDRGLKSIQVGEDPYDNRECRGRATWTGILHAKPGTRDLAVRVTDRAGNVTATSIALDPREYATRRESDQYGFDGWPSLRDTNQLWNYASVGAFRPGIELGHPAQVWPLAARGAHTDIGRFAVPSLTSNRVRLPAATLEFREFEGRTLVQTPHDNYFLQGEVRYARGPVTIKITVDGKKLPSKPPVVKTGDCLAFCECIPLPEKDPVGIVVEASFQDGSPIKAGPLQVKRVPNCVYEPNAVYGIMLLPLQEKPTPTDPNGEHKNLESTHKIVLNALRECKPHDPCDQSQSCRRFNSEALDELWSAANIHDELSRLGVAQSSPETMFAELAARYNQDGQKPQIELGFFGDIVEDANSLEIILGVIDVKNDQYLFRKIDIFGRKDDPDRPNWHTEGLIAKLLATMPRVHAKITGLPKGRVIMVDRGRSDGVFQRMDVGLYQEDEGCFRNRGSASIDDVQKDSSAVQIEDKDTWEAIALRPRSFAVISK